MKIVWLLVFFLIPTNVNAIYTDSVVNVFEMDIIEIQEAVAKGYLNYEMLTKMYLERIEEYDKNFNTIITLNDNVLIEAKLLDLEFQKTGRRSLLHGIPIVIKDNIDVFDMPTTAGAKALLTNYPKKNADLVEKLIANGALIIGKTNMSEFSFSARNSYSSFGHVYNAYDRRYSSYGSSGGTAVAVALGFATVGIGTDTNSSIRVPASAASLIGLRPTYGSVSNEGIISYDKERDVAGPIARNVIDAYLVYNAISEVANIDFDNKLDNVRIGLLTDFFETSGSSSISPLRGTYKPINQLMTEAVNVLDDLGATIIELEGIYTSYYNNIRLNTYSGFLFCYDFNQYLKNTEGPIRNYNDLIRNGGFVRNLYLYNYSCNADARNFRLPAINLQKQEFSDYVAEIMNYYDVDVLLYPTLKNEVLKLDGSNTSNFNSVSGVFAPVSGMPAITVPIGFHNSLPYGMEILARHNDEATLFQISYAFQNKTNFYYMSDLTPLLFEEDLEKMRLKMVYDQYYNDVDYKDLNHEAKQVFWGEIELDEHLIIRYKNKHVPTYQGNFEIVIPIVKAIIPLMIISVFIYTHFLIIHYTKKY